MLEIMNYHNNVIIITKINADLDVWQVWAPLLWVQQIRALGNSLLVVHNIMWTSKMRVDA